MDYLQLIKSPTFNLGRLRRLVPLVKCICIELEAQNPPLAPSEFDQVLSGKLEGSYPRNTPQQESQYLEEDYYAILTLLADVKESPLGWIEIGQPVPCRPIP